MRVNTLAFFVAATLGTVTSFSKVSFAQTHDAPTTPTTQTPTTPFPGQGALEISGASYSLRIRGYLQGDFRYFFGQRPGGVDTFLIRRARPIFEGSAFKIIELKLMPDFASTPLIYDAYMDIKPTRGFRLRFGKDKVPVSLDQLRSDRYLVFVERTQSAGFVSTRDVGIQAIFDLWNGALNASIGLFNGTPDGVNGDLAIAGSRDGVMRVFATPFRSVPALRGLGFGVAGSFGTDEGAPSSPALGSYKTVGQATEFSYRSDTSVLANNAFASGVRARLAGQLYYNAGPFELLAEVIRSDQQIHVATHASQLTHYAYSATASAVVTGESATWEGFTPKRDFDPAHGGAGGFMISARTHGVHFDPRAFPVFADPNASVQAAWGYGAAITWAFNPAFKVQAAGDLNIFRGGAKSGDREAERVLEIRGQAAF